MEKRIGTGVSCFEVVIDNYYHIDKTKIIEEIFNDKEKVKLFTRPRISGKTFTLNMLKNFFDIKESENNKNLFRKLYIEKSLVMKEQGKYPVIFLSMFHIDSEEIFKYKISEIYGEFFYIRETLDEADTKIFNKICFREEECVYNYSLKPLMKMLKKYYNKEIILLIDEYDAPLIKGHKKGEYEKFYKLLDWFYGEILNENEYLKFSVITGVENFKFNNIDDICSYGVLDNKYSEYFGLTERELDKILTDFNQIENKQEIEKWYGGYRYGDTKIYNIWSVLKFLSKENEFTVYWHEGGSENYFIKYMIEKFSFETSLKKLSEGESIEVNFEDTITEEKIENGDSFFTFMISCGFLAIEKKLSGNKYLVKIPNQEVKKFFEKLFIESFKKEKSKHGIRLNLEYL